jgi:hypothetical protein
MKSRVFKVSLLLGAIGMLAATAGEPPPSGPSDPLNADPLPEATAERPLASLASRCQVMLDKQIAVHKGTVALHKVRKGRPGGEPRPEDREALLQLSDNEEELIAEATKILGMLKADGAAVAFSEVFEALRGDMERVRSRLTTGDVGPATQAIQKDVIETLQDMIAALKRR